MCHTSGNSKSILTPSCVRCGAVFCLQAKDYLAVSVMTTCVVCVDMCCVCCLWYKALLPHLAVSWALHVACNWFSVVYPSHQHASRLMSFYIFSRSLSASSCSLKLGCTDLCLIFPFLLSCTILNSSYSMCPTKTCPWKNHRYQYSWLGLNAKHYGKMSKKAIWETFELKRLVVALSLEFAVCCLWMSIGWSHTWHSTHDYP